MNYLKIFGDPSEHFIKHLKYKLSEEILYFILNLYNTCEKNNEKNLESDVLVKFQKILEQVPFWDIKLIKQETFRIKKNIPFIEDLLNSVLISLTRLLINNNKNNNKIKIKIPKLFIFIHNCYILIAKDLWKYTYLFSKNINPLTIQENKFKIYNIIENNINNTLFNFLPLKKILKYYINNNLNNNKIELSDDLNNIIENNDLNLFNLLDKSLKELQTKDLTKDEKENIIYNDNVTENNSIIKNENILNNNFICNHNNNILEKEESIYNNNVNNNNINNNNVNNNNNNNNIIENNQDLDNLNLCFELNSNNFEIDKEIKLFNGNF